ncbi:MAG: response regulator [Ardenticatenales bacterium]|nr:response regulator [Ardenticatenales bacterium]
MDILLVEDNAGDVRLIQEAFQEAQMRTTLHLAADGERALAFLRQEPGYEAATRPDLILLDLNLPRMDGTEVLAQIKADPHLKRIPVVVLTTSQAREDILKSYDLHANCYITKPADLSQFLQVVAVVEQFWFETVQLPPD